MVYFEYMRSLSFILPVFLFFFLFLSVPHSFAQQLFNAYEFDVSERNPSPGEEVGISLRSRRSSTSTIRSVRWYFDDVEQKDLKNSMKIAKVSSGVPQKISADIIYFVGESQQQFTAIEWLRPIIFDLLWEADSVVTPLYRGHRLAGPEVPIRVVAKIQYTDPRGTTYTEKDFSFRWQVESEYRYEQGPGVSSIVYEEGGGYFNNYVTVEAIATLISNSSVSVERVVSVPIVEPRLLVYPFTLLYGLSTGKTIPKEAIVPQNQKITLSVYPFYFSRESFVKNAIQYIWFANEEVSPLKRGRKLDISVTGDLTFIPVKIVAQNEEKNSQQAENLFSLSL